MKKLKWLPLIMVLLLLSACSLFGYEFKVVKEGEEELKATKGEDRANEKEEKDDDDRDKDEERDKENKDSKKDNKKSDKAKKESLNGPKDLKEVGDIAETTDYSMELLEYKKIKEKVDLKPIKASVSEIKLIELNDISERRKEEYSIMTRDELEDGDVLLYILFKAENTSDKKIDWYGLDVIVTDKKEQYDVMMSNFFFDTNMSSTFHGEVQRDYEVGIVLKKPDINKVKLVFSDVVDRDTYDRLAEKEEIEVSFD